MLKRISPAFVLLAVTWQACAAAGVVRVACVGDSITYGARLDNRDQDSYPACLQRLLGEDYAVTNFGVGGCTLIRKGKPTVWNQLDQIRAAEPDIVVVSLGTNDTVGGNRKCWDHKDEFPQDCRDLVDALRAMPSHPRVWLCLPTPMVLDTPGLSAGRLANLEERKPRLQELIGVITQVAEEKHTKLIDLNTPLAGKPELFTETDGVHPNHTGYQAVAKLVYRALRSEHAKQAAAAK